MQTAEKMMQICGDTDPWLPEGGVGPSDEAPPGMGGVPYSNVALVTQVCEPLHKSAHTHRRAHLKWVWFAHDMKDTTTESIVKRPLLLKTCFCRCLKWYVGRCGKLLNLAENRRFTDAAVPGHTGASLPIGGKGQ